MPNVHKVPDTHDFPCNDKVRNDAWILDFVFWVLDLLIEALVTRCRQLQQSVVLLGRNIIIEIIHRINRIAVSMHFIMAVGARTFPGAAYPSDYFASFDMLTIFCFYTKHMTV